MKRARIPAPGSGMIRVSDKPVQLNTDAQRNQGAPPLIVQHHAQENT